MTPSNSTNPNKEAFGIAGRKEVKTSYLLAKLLTPADINRQKITSPEGITYHAHLDRQAKYLMIRDNELAAIISFQTLEYYNQYDRRTIERRAEIRSFDTDRMNLNLNRLGD